MRVFVTGGTGFVGSHLIEALRRDGHQVRALVRPGSDRSYLESLGAEPFVGDLEQPDSVSNCCDGCEVVFHAAARVDIVGSDDEFRRTTVDGTRALINAAKVARTRRFVYVSSCAVYHPRIMSAGVIDERTAVDSPPEWFRYGRSKLAAEQVVREQFAAPLEWVIIRLGYVFGPRNRSMKQYLEPLLGGGYMRYVGDGHNEMAMIHVRDAADAILACATVAQAAGQILIASGTERVTQRRYFDSLTKGMQLPPIRGKVPYTLAFAAAWVFEKFKLKHPAGESFQRAGIALTGLPQRIDCSYTRDLLGWNPQIPFDQGIREACDWYLREHRRAESAAATQS